MKVTVGTTNPSKTEAVKEALKNYPMLKEAEIAFLKVESRVSEQPKTLKETVTGAKTRAKRAFIDCTYSIGIEDGLMKVPGTKTGYMNICICAIFNGKKYAIGTGPSFEYPIKATELVIKEGKDMNQAFYELKITDNPQVGSGEGAIGILTKGRVVRKDTAKYAVMMALLQIENKELY